MLNWKAGIQTGYKTYSLSLQFSYRSQQYAGVTNAVEGGYCGLNDLLRAYHLLDLSAGWHWKRYNVDTSINNLANTTCTTRRATGHPKPDIIPGDGHAFFLTLGLKL